MRWRLGLTVSLVKNQIMKVGVSNIDIEVRIWKIGNRNSHRNIPSPYRNCSLEKFGGYHNQLSYHYLYLCSHFNL